MTTLIAWEEDKLWEYYEKLDKEEEIEIPRECEGCAYVDKPNHIKDSYCQRCIDTVIRKYLKYLVILSILISLSYFTTRIAWDYWKFPEDEFKGRALTPQ